MQISKQMTKYRHLFDNEKIELVSEQYKRNHVIDLKLNQKSLFMSLYNLSQKELTKFRRYLNDVLIKD